MRTGYKVQSETLGGPIFPTKDFRNIPRDSLHIPFGNSRNGRLLLVRMETTCVSSLMVLAAACNDDSG